MRKYMEILDALANATKTNGGGKADYNQARAIYLAEIAADELGLEKDQIADLKVRFFFTFEKNAIPANTSAQRQALEKYRKGDEKIESPDKAPTSLTEV